MKNCIGFSVALSAALLSGCETPRHSVVNSEKEGEGHVCKVANVDILKKDFLNLESGSGNYLGIKKADSNTMKFWIRFTPDTPKKDPVANPGVILKLYKNGKLTHDYHCDDGFTHDAIDLFMGFPQNQTTFSSIDIWPHASKSLSIQNIMEKAVSFSISKEQFDKILDVDKVEFRIQTHYDPLIISMEKNSFPPLREFKRECYN